MTSATLQVYKEVKYGQSRTSHNHINSQLSKERTWALFLSHQESHMRSFKNNNLSLPDLSFYIWQALVQFFLFLPSVLENISQHGNRHFVYFLPLQKQSHGLSTFIRTKSTQKETFCNFHESPRNRTRMPTFPVSIQHSTRSPSQGNQPRQRIKRGPEWKKEIEFSLFSDNMITYIENPNSSMKTLLN